MTAAIDWRALADQLGTLSPMKDGVYTERGGTDLACQALVEIIGDAAWRDAVDFYVSCQRGSELTRSVLWLLRPPAAMERCREIFRGAPDTQAAADAINLLQVVADRRVLPWIPEFLASDNVGVRVWGIGIVDQLLIMQDAIDMAEAMPLLETALADPAEAVQSRARDILEMAREKLSDE